jgi:hypothetical protein
MLQIREYEYMEEANANRYVVKKRPNGVFPGILGPGPPCEARDPSLGLKRKCFLNFREKRKLSEISLHENFRENFRFRENRKFSQKVIK